MLNQKETASQEVIAKVRKRRRFRKKRPNERCYNLNELWGALQVMREAWKLFKKFSSDTSMHGIKYMTEEGRPWPERVYWAIAIFLSFKFATSLSYKLYQKWDTDTDDFRFTEKNMNVWQIPFSAVTICPIGGPNPLNEDYRMNDLLSGKPMKSMKSDISETIKNVVWRSNRVDPRLFFAEVATEEGFCYTFNMIKFDDIFKQNVSFKAFDNLKIKNKPNTSWELKQGYFKDTNMTNNYPYRVSGAGEASGLKFEIWRNISDVLNGTSSTHGFKLVIHSPGEVPQFDKHYYRFPVEKSVTLVIRPSLMVSEDLEEYSKQIRQCYYENEHELRYFKKYTRSNCQLECLANFTETSCGCVHFSMPSNNSTKICDSEASLNCYKDAKRQLTWKTMEQSLETSKKIDDRGNPECKCSPSCTSLNYDARISHDDNRYFASRGSARNKFRTTVSIFFKDDDIIFYKPYSDVKSWSVKFADLVTNFCGLWGMFIGISTITIVEIVYFLILRRVDADDECI